MSRPLQLAFVLLDYFPFGGQQRDFMKIALAAIAAGHQVTALVHSWQGDCPSGLRVVELPADGRSNHRRLRNFSDQVTAWCRQHKPDLRIGFLRMPGLDCYFAADPCFRARSVASYGRWIEWLPRYRVLLELERAVFAPTSHCHILTLTEREKAIYQRCYGTADARFTALPAGVTADFHAVDETARADLRQHYGIAEQTVLLLMVGSHFKTKGVDRSLHAIAELPASERSRCQLWIAGAGKPATMQRLAERLGIAAQVTFLGGRADVADLMRAADVLLQPSRTELAGMSIVEALSSHLPVIVSGECGYAFHVAGAAAGTALPSPFRQMDFTQALHQLLPAEPRQRARERAADYAASHDLRSLATVALAVIERVADERAAVARPDRPN